MTPKTVLVAGATGLVGYACLKHFAAEEGCDVIALSRRKPDETYGARWYPLDLADAAACAALAPHLAGVTHLVYAALYEQPGLVAGWREDEQIRLNEAMLRNLFEPLEAAAPQLRHVALLQGTKAYGVHVRPLAVPARENRSEMHEQPNFYWNQERFVRERQRGKGWRWSILRPVLIVGDSVGSAMNVIPALGVYAAMMRRSAKTALDYPGGVGRVAQAVDADLLARAIAWSGEADKAANEIFNVTNGDVFVWPNVWPAIARAFGMAAGAHVPLALDREIRPREAEWAEIRREHGLVSGTLKDFVGLSFEYADYTMGHGRTQPGPPALVSTIKLMQAGFTEVMDTEAMFAKAIAEMQAKKLLPR
ncbi:MAG: NAD-dependent epimerase/dehydratase family protein [Reyranella sp.]|uniref:NAD-dependent epimerase/dehydratase family protein n=1 Tax=Reyranella sp. TaxID=1929291 RepID=UPI001AC85253|nr:NAD-dependent epimerase/dehydratase family protein [Reyranella sp.]MBN9086111.1 NAD-dependent epimerase/dehydratase family protein [Reyranella sp.]